MRETSEEQRDALEKLRSGKYGGPFFEIFSSIAPHKRETVVTSVEVENDRERRVATIRIGDFGSSTIQPIKSPATVGTGDRSYFDATAAPDGDRRT